MNARDRFFAKVGKIPGGCWLWLGTLDRKGYGDFSFQGRKRKAHRWIYRQEVGEIPKGMVIDHAVCDVRRCVNPAHLRVTTNRANIMRSPHSIPHKNAAKTHCRRGHPLSGDNLKIDSRGHRECIACRRLRRRSEWRDDAKAVIDATRHIPNVPETDNGY